MALALEVLEEVREGLEEVALVEEDQEGLLEEQVESLELLDLRQEELQEWGQEASQADAAEEDQV